MMARDNIVPSSTPLTYSSTAGCLRGPVDGVGEEEFKRALYSDKENPLRGSVNVVYIANGMGFPDALSGAPIAGKRASG